ncbi:MAG: hypothetical protein ACPGO7_04330 [Alphaproteobacteria bacterium]
MASIDYDPFFVRLQELGCELGSEEYVQALIWRLNMELKPDGKKIEAEDYFPEQGYGSYPIVEPGLPPLPEKVLLE